MINLSKTLKWVLIPLITIALIIVIGITLLITLVNPNRFKPMIISATNNATGRQLALDGNISWTIYPNLGLKIESISLSNPKEFQSTKFMQLNSANIAVELIPLLEHKIIFKALDINGLNLVLIKKGNLNNWTFTQNTPPTIQENTEKQNTLITFNALSLTNSTISYNDIEQKTHKKIKNINLKIDSGIGGGIKLDSKADTLTLHKVYINYNDDVDAKINLIVTNLAAPKYTGSLDFKQLHINKLLNDVNLSPKTAPPLLNNVAFTANLDGDTNNVQISNLNFDINHTLNGTLDLNITDFKNPNLKGNIALPNFSANKVMVELALSPIEIANKELLDKISFKTSFAGSSKNFNFTNLVLKLADSTAIGNVNITSFKPMSLTENINLDHFDVSNISNINGFKVPLSGIHLKGNSSLNGNGIKSLNGKQTVTIDNISLLGFDLNQQIHRMNAILTNGNHNKALSSAANSVQLNQDINKVKASINSAMKPGPKDYKLKSNLGNFSLNANFHNGIASPSKFNLSGPDLILSGNGSLNIPNKSLNYKISSKVVTTGIDPLFSKLTVEANVNGTFKDPSINLDWGSLIRQLLTYALQNDAAAIKKEINQQIQNGINQQIKQALSKTDKNTTEASKKTGAALTKAIDSIFGK